MVYAHVGHAAPLVRASLENPAKTDAPPLASRIYGLCAGSYSHTSASPVASYLEDISIELNPGDKVILYSKGYLNNEHPNQNPSHSPKIEACLAETFDKSTQATADHLVKDFHIPSTPQWQDVTIIVVAIDRSWGQRRANLNQSV